VPLPCPDDGSSPATQLASAVAVHAHSGVVDTMTVPTLAEAASGESGPVNVTRHLIGDGPVEVTDVEPHAARGTRLATTSKDSRVRRLIREKYGSKDMGRVPSQLLATARTFAAEVVAKDGLILRRVAMISRSRPTITACTFEFIRLAINGRRVGSRRIGEQLRIAVWSTAPVEVPGFDRSVAQGSA